MSSYGCLCTYIGFHFIFYFFYFIFIFILFLFLFSFLFFFFSLFILFYFFFFFLFYSTLCFDLLFPLSISFRICRLPSPFLVNINILYERKTLFFFTSMGLLAANGVEREKKLKHCKHGRRRTHNRKFILLFLFPP